MKNALKIFPALLLCLVFFSCQENEVPETLLEQVGFEGTFPDGSTFGTTNIRSSNGVGISGVNFKYSGRHFLDIRTFDYVWTISLETPSKPFPDDTPRGENIPIQVFSDLFSIHFPYEDLRELFLSEKSKADSDPSYTSFEKLKIQISNMEKFYFYLTSNIFPSKGGKVRVLEVEEGIMKNLDDQDVRKIEVVIEFDLPMKASDPSVAIQEGNLKGIARFRYREDFYQGEFERR
jgi:hypothetical protein